MTSAPCPARYPERYATVRRDMTFWHRLRFWLIQLVIGNWAVIANVRFIGDVELDRGHVFGEPVTVIYGVEDAN